MALRSALYARCSSDQQRAAASIQDQFRGCRERAAHKSWKIAAMIAVIDDNGYNRGMVDRLSELESHRVAAAAGLGGALRIPAGAA